MAVIPEQGSIHNAKAANAGVQLADIPRIDANKLIDADGGREKLAGLVKRKKHEEDEFQNTGDDVGVTTEEVAAGQDGPMLLAQAETAGAEAASSATGGGAAGAGAASGGAASAGTAAGGAAGAEAAAGLAFSDATLGTMILAGTVGVAAAASGGGSAAAAAVAPTVGFTLSGLIALGQVNSNTGLVLEAFKADGTALPVSSSVVNADGTFTIAISVDYAGPVLLRLKDTTTGNDYFDEGSGVSKDITTDLRAVVNVSGSGGANITVAITPLTELAARQLLGDSGGDAGSSATTLGAATTSQAVTDANNSVKTAFGLTSDIVATTPVTVDNTTATGATTAQLAYGQVLAAISGMETVQAVSSGQVLGQLSQAIVPTATGAATLSASAADLLVQGAQQVQTAAAATPANYVANTATTLVSAVTASVGTSITGLTLSSDTGISNKDFITNSAAAQTVTGTLGGALGTNLLWGSLDNGTSWTDITLTAVNGTALSWSVGVLTSTNVIQLAQTTSTATATTVAANLVAGTKVVVQSYVVDAAAPAAPTVAAVAGAADATAAEATAGAAAVTAENLSTVAVTFTGTAGAVTKTIVGNGAAQAVALTAPDLTALGEGAVGVSAVATDIAGNASAAGAGTFNLDTVVPVITSVASASVAENTAQATAVYTAVATDTNTLAYTLGGADAALFSINAATGAVSFNASPNFEAPADANADNVYDLTVIATDTAGNATSQAVSITVTNVNETPTLTSLATASFAENGTGVAYTVTATDPDAGAVLTYALAGADAALFTINASTGAVSFVDPLGPNFEAPRSNVYNIDVTASDGTITTAAQAVAITVTNVNEAPTVVAQNAPATQVFAVNQPIPAQTSVAGMFVDPDANTGPGSFGALTYTATGLPADNSIMLDPTTGVITGTPNTTGNIPIRITATDGGGSSIFHDMTVSIVTAPVISSIVANVAQATSGNALIFTATISEAVTVTGAPTLTLDVGGTPMTATYTSGTGTNALTFTATAPASSDATVTVTAIDVGLGSVIGNTTTQPLVTATTGQVVANFVVDNSAPVFAGTAAVSYAENGTAAVFATTFTDATALTYAALSGDDASLFNITNGALSFNASPNFEMPADLVITDNVYNVTVTATDAFNHTTSQAVTINVTGVNEAPTVNQGVPAQQIFAVGQAITTNNNVTGMFVDPDAGDTLTYMVTGLPAGITFDPVTNLVTGTPTTTTTTPVNVTFTATDAGGLFVSHQVAVSVVAAPTIASTIDNVTNFDVSSNIVLTASEAVTGVAGKFIRIVNDANDVTNAGFHGETTANTQTIDATAVTIVGNTITINPGFDLDLSNNYHIEVDAGAFIGTSGMGSIAVTDPFALNFSTVTPGTAAGGVAGAVASQKMVSGTDAMASSFGWWDIETLGSTVSGAVSADLGTGSIAVVFKDYDPAAGSAATGYTGIGSPGDDYVALLNFGNNDLLYIDNQTNTAASDLTQTAVIHSGVAPVRLQFDGYTPNGGQPIWVDITTTAGTTAFDTVAQLQTLLATSYSPVLSA